MLKKSFRFLSPGRTGGLFPRLKALIKRAVGKTDRSLKFCLTQEKRPLVCCVSYIVLVKVKIQTKANIEVNPKA